MAKASVTIESDNRVILASSEESNNKSTHRYQATIEMTGLTLDQAVRLTQELHRIHAICDESDGLTGSTK